MSRAADVISAITFGLVAARRSPAAVLWSWLSVLLVSLPFASVVAALVFALVGATPPEATAPDAPALGGLTSPALRGLAGPGIFGFSAELVVLLFRAPGVPLFAGALIGSSLVLWAVLSAFFTGATIAAVHRGAPTSMHELFTLSGRVFGRLLRLLGFGLPFGVVVVGLAFWGVRWIVGGLTDTWVAEGWVLVVRLAGLACVLAVASWAAGAYDLMRVEAVSRGEHRARWAFVRGLGRALRSPASVLAVALPFQLGTIGLTLLALGVDVRIPRDSFLTIGIAFILEQTAALGRAWLRVATLGAEVAWVKKVDGVARRATGGRARDEARARDEGRGRDDERGAKLVIDGRRPGETK